MLFDSRVIDVFVEYSSRAKSWRDVVELFLEPLLALLGSDHPANVRV